MTARRAGLTALLGLTGIAAALLAGPGRSSATVRHAPLRPVTPRAVHAVPVRSASAGGQRITGHPDMLAAVNAARTRNGWPAVRYGNNLAAEACALDTSRCNGVQWGGCPLTPLPGNRYTLTIGTAVSNGPHGCIQAISYSSFD